MEFFLYTFISNASKTHLEGTTEACCGCFVKNLEKNGDYCMLLKQ